MKKNLAQNNILRLAADIKANTCIVERMSRMLSGSTLDDASVEAHAAKIKKSVSKKHKAVSGKNR
jgi:hypothetical protein